MTRDPLFWQQQYLKIYTKNVSRDNAGQNLNQNNVHGPTNRIKNLNCQLLRLLLCTL